MIFTKGRNLLAYRLSWVCDYYCVYFWLLVTILHSQLSVDCIPSLKHKNILLFEYNFFYLQINMIILVGSFYFLQEVFFLQITVSINLSTFILILIFYLKGWFGNVIKNFKTKIAHFLNMREVSCLNTCNHLGALNISVHLCLTYIVSLFFFKMWSNRYFSNCSAKFLNQSGFNVKLFVVAVLSIK